MRGRGFPSGSVVRNLPAGAGDTGSIPGGGRKWQPPPVFLPGQSHGQRSLARCGPWGHRVGHNLAAEQKHTHQQGRGQTMKSLCTGRAFAAVTNYHKRVA